jgi:hypothetical protein
MVRSVSQSVHSVLVDIQSMLVSVKCIQLDTVVVLMVEEVSPMMVVESLVFSELVVMSTCLEGVASYSGLELMLKVLVVS